MISTQELVEALRQLRPDQIAGLLAEEHRSPVRERQLHDLTLKPSKDDPRPTFYQETDGREFHPIRHSPYPKLLWHTQTKQEITVNTPREEKDRGPLWTAVAPVTIPLDPETQARRLFESLSVEDQAFIVEHQRLMKLEQVKKAMGQLTESQANAVVAAKGNGKK